MRYIEIGLAIFFISHCLLFMGLYFVEGVFMPGLIVLWIGVVLMAIGVMKRDGLVH